MSKGTEVLECSYGHVFGLYIDDPKNLKPGDRYPWKWLGSKPCRRILRRHIFWDCPNCNMRSYRFVRTVKNNGKYLRSFECKECEYRRLIP